MGSSWACHAGLLDRHLLIEVTPFTNPRKFPDRTFFVCSLCNSNMDILKVWGGHWRWQTFDMGLGAFYCSNECSCSEFNFVWHFVISYCLNSDWKWTRDCDWLPVIAHWYQHDPNALAALKRSSHLPTKGHAISRPFVHNNILNKSCAKNGVHWLVNIADLAFF